MNRCNLSFQPLNFYAPFVTPEGVDPQPLRHALYSDAVAPETLPAAPVLLFLLPGNADAVPETFFLNVSRLCTEKGAAPIFAADVSGLSREESTAAMEKLWRRLAAAGFPGTRPFPVNAPAAVALFEGGDERLAPEERNPALRETGIPALAERLRAMAGRVAAFSPPVAAAPAPPDPVYWLDRVAAASDEDLNAVERDLIAADPRRTCQEAFAAVTRRRWEQKLRKAKEMTAGFETAGCTELKAIIEAVRLADFPPALRDKTLDKLAPRYAEQQKKELDELTADTEALSVEELRKLIQKIKTGPFETPAAAPYLQRLSGQINLRHLRQLDAVCEGVESADEQTLGSMRRAVCAVDCLPEIRSEYLARIDRRNDALALQTLDELTHRVEYMDAPTLKELERKLEKGDYSKKFVNRYIAKVREYKEAAIYRSLMADTETANTLDRQGVLALQARIEGRQMPTRILRMPLDRIAERLYRLDMLALIKQENDFDSLGYADLDALRARVERSDYCDRAKKEYLERLNRREHDLVYDSTASRAALVQQLIDKCRLRQVDFDISIYTKDYDARLQRFWGGTGKEEPRDIPVFLLASAVTVGMSSTKFWYSNGRGVTFVPLTEIDNFRLNRQMLSVVLMIQKVDGSFLPTPAKLFRNNAEQVAIFLNECLRCWSSPMALPQSTSVRTGGAPSFDPEIYREAVGIRLPEQKDLSRQLREDYAKSRLKEGSFSREDPEERGKLLRLLQGFELSPATRIVWYKAPLSIGSVREGIALGPEGIYTKASKTPTRFMPMEAIFSVEAQGDRGVLIRGTDNSETPLDVSPVMASLIDNYCKGIQLVNLLRRTAGAEA